MTETNRRAAAIILACALLTACLSSGCAKAQNSRAYGVFLGVTEDLEKLCEYETVVIDAQYFSREEIAAFKAGGHTVYTYINVGSLEDLRPYYGDFKDLGLGRYENWDEEIWIDVSDSRWQSFLIGELIPELLEKGVDGFFADNCDVYYNFPTEPVMEGLTVIMRALVSTGRAVLINGGDTYLDAYCASGGNWRDVVTGINQETVFTQILWESGGFGEASDEDRGYFTDYIERYAAMGADVYLLEYTTSRSLSNKIAEYCREHGFLYFISDSVELD